MRTSRVIEIPTPRWNAYDAKRLGSEFPEETKMIIQDRAYTSPIWYTPQATAFGEAWPASQRSNRRTDW